MNAIDDIAHMRRQYEQQPQPDDDSGPIRIPLDEV